MEGSRYPKRERKPKVAYTVPSPKQKVRKSVEKVKHRNRAADGSKENKWKTYRDMIKKSVNCLLKEMQTLEVKFEGKTAPARGKNTLWELERMECEKKIFTAKEAIVTTLQAVAHENEDHKRWPQLLDDQKDVDDGEEDDGVDVDDIYCSLCNEEETEDNDILLCDRAGCGRAYHQKCLDPPIDMMNVDPKHDWFCWQCECMDDCLDIISERLEVEYWDWKDVFPDVRMALEGVSNGEVGDTILTVDLPDDEEDDDYDPSDDDEEDGGEDENEDEDDDEEEQQQVDDEVENDDRVASDGLGEERVEDEENDEDGDDDEEMDDDGDDDDDNIDNDELQGLLEDANIPMEIVQEESEEVPISRRLRQRNQKKETVEIELLGPGDVGKFIARVRRGLFELGKILEYLPKEQINSSSADEVESNDVNVLSGHWKVRFSKKFLKEVLNHGNDEAEKEKETSETNEDMNTTEVEVEAEKSHYGDVEKEVQEAVENEGEEKSETSQKKIRDKKSEEELLLNAENITAGLLMYQDYIERLQRIESSNISQSRQKAMQELVESTGKLDEANIITSKRERKALDYAQLSLELFGTLADYDSSSDEDVKSDDGRKQSRRKSKQPSGKKKRDESEENSEEEGFDLEEIDEEIDAEWDEKKKKGNNRKPKPKPKESTKNEEKKKRSRKTDSEEKSKKKRRKEIENNNNNDDEKDNIRNDNRINQEEEGEFAEIRGEEISDQKMNDNDMEH